MSLQRPQLPLSFFEQPLELTPHFSTRPWGGMRLGTVLGKKLPKTAEPIGESWELSDHPSGRSFIVAPGTAADGLAFGDLIRTYPREMVGSPAPPASGYPLLVKYIDATNDLSVQVHPDDAWCEAHGHADRGKSECWYVMDCPPDARIIHGYKPGVTEADARAAVAAGKLDDLLRWCAVKPGDFITVPPRTVHAILAGLLVCEIQQSSNLTFRLHDWNREPARELNVEHSMEVTNWDCSAEDYFQRLGPLRCDTTFEALIEQCLLANDFFTVHVVDLAADYSSDSQCMVGATGRIISVVGGEGSMRGPGWARALVPGATWYVPAAMLGTRIQLQAGRKGLRLLATESLEI